MSLFSYYVLLFLDVIKIACFFNYPIRVLIILYQLRKLYFILKNSCFRNIVDWINDEGYVVIDKIN